MCNSLTQSPTTFKPSIHQLLSFISNLWRCIQNYCALKPQVSVADEIMWTAVNQSARMCNSLTQQSLHRSSYQSLSFISNLWRCMIPLLIPNTCIPLTTGLTSSQLLHAVTKAQQRGVFTCVEWQVTLCDHMWQVQSGSSEVEFH